MLPTFTREGATRLIATSTFARIEHAIAFEGMGTKDPFSGPTVTVPTLPAHMRAALRATLDA